MKKLIRHILKEETSGPLLAIRRRTDMIDNVFPKIVDNVVNRFGFDICQMGEPKIFIETVTDALSESLYWTYFSTALDDDTEQWDIIYRFIIEYVEDKYGEQLTQLFHANCGKGGINESKDDEKRLPSYILRRVDIKELENQFNDSIKFIIDIYARQGRKEKPPIGDFMDSVTNVMLDNLHYDFYTTIPKENLWARKLIEDFKDYYGDRIKKIYLKTYNERIN
jgi:hypothetical protein